MKIPITARFIALICALLWLPAAFSQTQNGEPSRSIEHEMIVQRASEVAVWAMPAVSVYERVSRVMDCRALTEGAPALSFS